MQHQSQERLEHQSQERLEHPRRWRGDNHGNYHHATVKDVPTVPGIVVWECYVESSYDIPIVKSYVHCRIGLLGGKEKTKTNKPPRLTISSTRWGFLACEDFSSSRTNY